MKNNIRILVIVFLPLMMFFGCKERTDLTGPKPESGQADFSTFAAIGNSLTAGYESSALFESAQMYSFGNLISQQVNTPFVQPIISDPGIGGQIQVVSLDPFVTTQVQSQGTLTNPAYAHPYNNLGIPGIVLADVMNATSSQNSLSHSPFIDIVLRGQGSVFTQVQALNPTMVTLWIGNNDVLGFATSGGYSPKAPTPSQTFGSLYNQLADGLAATGAKVVAANIPDVTTIPFFTTVGPQFAQKVQGVAPGFYYQKHDQFTGTVAQLSSLTDYSILFTLVAQPYLAYFGQPSGKFYKDHNADITILIALGILDTTQAFGSEKNPIPDALVLDNSEIQTAAQSTAEFNAAIAAAVNKYPSQFALVDVNALLTRVRASDASGGTEFQGIKFSTTFVTGGLFSLDGVHPTAQGYAIIANEFLKVINSKFNASYSLVDISTIPGTLSFAKAAHFNLFSDGVYLDPAAYENILF